MDTLDLLDGTVLSLLLVVLLMELLLLGSFLEVLMCHLFQSICRDFYLVKISLRCWCSVLSTSGVEQTALALCAHVLITMHFATI